MEMLNRVMVIGRLTKDPELKKTQSGYTIANVTVAADRPTKKEEKTDFINCVAWEKTADIVDRFGRKGLLVYVDGRLEVDSYKAADGSNRNLTRVNVGTFIALEKVDLKIHMQGYSRRQAQERNGIRMTCSAGHSTTWERILILISCRFEKGLRTGDGTAQGCGSSIRPIHQGTR